MHIGVTATRKGASLTQREFFRSWLELVITSRNPRRQWFHHGDCEGGDEQAHDIAEVLGFKIHTHPPDNPKLRAYKTGDREEELKPYLWRNKEIVDSSDLMFGLPDGPERIRSGTWSTLRYTKQVGRPYVIIFPNGKTEFGNGAKEMLRKLQARIKPDANI